VKVVINGCFGGYGLSEAAYKFLGEEWDGYGIAYKDDRTNPKLVECVEKLGEKAGMDYSRLKIVEIPDGTDFEITEYDGFEQIEEKHRIWR
jgi:hypothetical protein